MRTIYTEKHKLRDSKTELYGGELVPPFECPARAEHIINRVRDVALGTVEQPKDFGMDAILKIHSPAFVHFLETCWEEWKAEGFSGEAIATAWAGPTMRRKEPRNIDGKIGFYCLAAETAISDGTWEAAYHAAQTALTAQQEIAGGQNAAFALCRPPGHHAAADLFGGYCFLNNAAIAAQAFIDQGASRVAILDVDFHHGNGTQSIFYDRPDVLFCSLHGDPQDAFPYFLGYSDELGEGKGEGFNANYPLAPGSDFGSWSAALQAALSKIKDYGPDAVIVSLGVDTFEKDPISFFKLRSDDFHRYGEAIGQLKLPTLFVMEGGYAVEEIGINAVNVLTGFEQA